MKNINFAFMVTIILTGCPIENTTTRAIPEICDNSRPTQSFDATVSGCKSDDSCTDGANGRCVGVLSVLGPGRICTYDSCFNDDGCGREQVCSCGKDSHAEVIGRGDANQCVPANCKTNDDCGEQFCKPTGSTCPESDDRVFGYYCTTENDQCSDDTDCDGSAVCVFDEEFGGWGCIYGCE